MNKIQIEGNAVADSEIRYTGDGGKVGEVRVAVNFRYEDKKTNQWKDGQTEFFKIVCWDKKSNWIENFKKGCKIVAEGRLVTKVFDKKDGTKGYSLEIHSPTYVHEVITPKSVNKDQEFSTHKVATPAQEDQIPF